MSTKHQLPPWDLPVWSGKNGVHFWRHPRCQLDNRRSSCQGGETGCCSQSSGWVEFNKHARVVCFRNHGGHRAFFQWWILELHVEFWMRLTFFLSTKMHQALRELVRRLSQAEDWYRNHPFVQECTSWIYSSAPTFPVRNQPVSVYPKSLVDVRMLGGFTKTLINSG